jgi:hypothetical protein
MALLNAFAARTITAVAPVAAFPTTAAHFCLFNGEPVGGKSYDILICASTYATSAAAAEVSTLIAHNATVPVRSLPSFTAALGPLSMGGYAASGTFAQVGSAVTIVNSSVWLPLVTCASTAATTTIGLGTAWQGTGIFVVPPGGIFSLATLSATNAGTCHLSVVWREVQL